MLNYLNDFISNSPVMVFMWVFIYLSIAMAIIILIDRACNRKSESMGRKV